MRDVVWSDEALRDFASSIRHIAKDNRRAASVVADRVDATARLLAQTPVGHPGRVTRTYEKRVLRTPYIIAYALSDTTLTILRMIHTRRDWHDEAWPPSS